MSDIKYSMISALVCDLISKVTFDCDLFWNNQISSAEFTKRSKEYSKEFTESFASLIMRDAVVECVKECVKQTKQNEVKECLKN